MPIPLQIALTVGPLATYFLLLGAWQSGRDPKVIPGVVDFALLVFGVGGLVTFGPIGGILIRLLFPGESVWAWLALETTLALLALLWAPTTHNRIVVYNVDPKTMEQAVREVVAILPGQFLATLRGYEDRVGARGIWLDTSSRSRTGVIEAFGKNSEALAALTANGLRERLRGKGARTSPIARLWYTLAAFVIWVPMLVAVLSRGRIHAALRALRDKLLGD
jgi:hypothetical protein